MRGLINHTWSQPLFLCKSLAFRISGRDVFFFFFSFQKTSGWCMGVTVNCWDDICAGERLVLIVHAIANTSCFCLAIECEIVFLMNRSAYNTITPTNALTSISIFGVWLVSCMPGSMCFVWTLGETWFDYIVGFIPLWISRSSRTFVRKFTFAWVTIINVPFSNLNYYSTDNMITNIKYILQNYKYKLQNLKYIWTVWKVRMWGEIWKEYFCFW